MWIHGSKPWQVHCLFGSLWTISEVNSYRNYSVLTWDTQWRTRKGKVTVLWTIQSLHRSHTNNSQHMNDSQQAMNPSSRKSQQLSICKSIFYSRFFTWLAESSALPESWCPALLRGRGDNGTHYIYLAMFRIKRQLMSSLREQVLKKHFLLLLLSLFPSFLFKAHLVI